MSSGLPDFGHLRMLDIRNWKSYLKQSWLLFLLKWLIISEICTNYSVRSVSQAEKYGEMGSLKAAKTFNDLKSIVMDCVKSPNSEERLSS